MLPQPRVAPTRVATGYSSLKRTQIRRLHPRALGTVRAIAGGHQGSGYRVALVQVQEGVDEVRAGAENSCGGVGRSAGV